MDIDLLKIAGEAAYGDNWKSNLQRELGYKNRQSITNMLNGSNAVPEIQPQLISLLEIRKAKINNAIQHLSLNFASTRHNDDIDLNATVIALFEDGEYSDIDFATMEEANEWLEDEIDEDDRDRVLFRPMTNAEKFARMTMDEFSDVYSAKDVLIAIQSGEYEKSEQEYFMELAGLDEDHLGREYYTYFLKNEFLLTNNPVANFDDEPDFNFHKTISYKEYLMKHIQDMVAYVGKYF